MRLIRHDFRDMTLAFGLAFDLKRISRAGFALAWTAGVFFGALAILATQMQPGDTDAGGVLGAWQILFDSPWTLTRASLWALILLVWWLGFGYLNAPVFRSAALDIARDERERSSHIPPLCRQATLGPLLAVLIPAVLFLCVAAWAVLSLIPGAAGAVIMGLTVPLPLIAGLIGGAVLLIAVIASPMMGPTAMVEGRDYFEVVTRPMSYVMQRPCLYTGYWLAKIGVVASSALFGGAVLTIAWAMIAGALWMVGQADLVGDATAVVVNAPNAAPVGASHAFVLGLMFWASVGLLGCWLSAVSLSCDAIIYLLMRYRIDGITFDKITLAEERLQQLPSAADTARQAEEARQRFDEKQAEEARENEPEEVA